MNNIKNINVVNICLLIIGILLMFGTSKNEVLFVGIGFFVSSVINLVYINIPNKK